MHRPLLAAVLVATAALAACERRDMDEDERTGPALTLTLETPDALDWGGSGLLRVSLVNEGDEAAEGGVVEVYVPDWLEFGTVEPPGTAVTVVAGESETRLAYPLTDSIRPGERRTVVQHLRVVPPAPPAMGAPPDTLETVQLPPSNLIVRARLLTAAGEPAGVEVQTTLHFAGASGPLPRGTLPVPPDTTRAGLVPPDTVPADTAAPERPPGRGD